MAREVILIVDDNRQISDFLAGTMLPALGFETMVAYDARSAIRIVKKSHDHIDLMLLDLQLPDITGLDLLRKLADDGYHIPAILITGHGSEEVAVDAFRLGVQDYLGKPIDEDDLKRAIERALSRARLEREKAALTAQLEEEVSWLTALSKVGQSVTSSLDLSDVLRRIVEAGVFLTKAEEGFLALLYQGSGQLYLRAVKNLDENVAKTLHLPVNDTLVGRVIQTKRPLRAAQPTAQGPLKVTTGYLVHSLLHVPILSKGEALGVLSVTNRRIRHSFKERDEQVLCSLADYAAVALENVNLYQQAKQEIAERQRVEVALRESEERYALAVRAANDGLFDWNLKTSQIYFSPRWKEMLGYQDSEISDSPMEWLQRVHPDDIGALKMGLTAHIKGLSPLFESEYRIRHQDGSYHWMLSRGLAVFDQDGTALRLAGSQTDITARKQAEVKLLHDALYDSLSGLPNRVLFMDRLRRAVDRSRKRHDYQYAVLFMDLDRFKDINDSLGHVVGDQFLVGTARLLEKVLRPTDTVARLGGDEFVILLEDIKDISDATHIADRVQQKLMTIPALPEHTLFTTASIGIVLGLSSYTQPEDVLRDADIAMYRAKENGRARYEIFDTAMRDRLMQRLELETELQHAIDNNELLIHYQPILTLDSGRLAGFEALVRWQHPKRGLLLPSEFIPMAEDNGLIITIDRWVIRESCRCVVEWQRQYPGESPISANVNISGRQIAQTDFTDFIAQTLEETGIKANCLHLEIAESAIMESWENTEIFLSKLNELGVYLQIDDFGKCYTSLNYLVHYSVDALKIDPAFIQQITEEDSSLNIVQAIIRLTHGLGLSAVAEGVETQGQLSKLSAMQCEYAQGQLISAPLDGEKVAELLAKIDQGKGLLQIS